MRHYKVVLTKRAARMFDRARTEAQARYLDVEAKFGADELTELYRLMDRFIVALRGHEFEATDEPYRSPRYRDDDNGRWLTRAEGARRDALKRAFREGI